MADLIERQEAMYAVQEHYNKGGFDSYQDGDKMLKEIMAISSVDAVPVVRCKDCKYRDAETGFCEGRGWPMQLVPDDGFCDKGGKERKWINS